MKKSNRSVGASTKAASAAQLQREDSEKERKIKALLETLDAKGFTVRRERLKSGHGWKTVSGSCRMSGQRLLFVDRKLPLDEQLLFLSGVVEQLGAGPGASASAPAATAA